MAANPWAYWQAQLAWQATRKGPQPDFQKDRPEQGYFRGGRNEAVAIWWLGDQCLARVHRPNRTGGGASTQDYKGADVIGEQLFAWCCRNAITGAAYKAFVAKGLWPEEDGIRAPSPMSPMSSMGTGQEQGEDESGTAKAAQSRGDSATPEMKFSAEIDALVERAQAWLKSIGKVATQEQANKCANFATLAGQLEKEIDAARAAEKRPLDDAVKAVQARYKPILDRIDKVKRNLKIFLTPYLSEQARIAAQEAAEAARAREAALDAGQTPDLAGAVPSRSVAGTIGKVSLRTQKVYAITDLRAAAEFIASLNDPPQDFIEGVLSAARALAKNGIEVPGIEVTIMETVA